MRAAVVLLLAAVLTAGAGCDKLNSWRNGSVQESHDITKGDRIDVPEVEPVEASELADELPVDESWTILTSVGDGDGIIVNALSRWDTQETAMWVLTQLSKMGYATNDNPSAVLGGAIYSSDSAKYKSIYVKVGMNNAEQCTVELRGSN
jgi:hypothetical protein